MTLCQSYPVLPHFRSGADDLVFPPAVGSCTAARWNSSEPQPAGKNIGTREESVSVFNLLCCVCVSGRPGPDSRGLDCLFPLYPDRIVGAFRRSFPRTNSLSVLQ